MSKDTLQRSDTGQDLAATRDGAVPLQMPLDLRRDTLLFTLILAVAALLLTINPLGYFGGHWDDGRYLEAAQAWAAHGPALGANHWSLRWPVIAPTALAIRWFGLSRATLMLPGLATLAAVLTVCFWATRRQFGAAVAALACLALLTTPEPMRAATRLTADLPELLFWSSALWAFWFGRDGNRGWLLTAGVAAACAWATRETGLGLLLLFALAFVAGFGPRRVDYGWIAAGFVAVWLPEQLALWAASGDPLYRIHVDMRHIEIASNDLAGGTAPGASAPLNAGLMRRWSGAGPLRLHWALDPWLNLFINPAYGLDVVLAALGLAWLRRGRLQARSLAAVVGAIAASNVACTVYIIATDPKPRMFMPAIGAACLLLAVVAFALWSHGYRRVLIAAAAIKLIALLVMLDVATGYSDLPALTRAALAAAPGPVHVDSFTASALALVDADLRARLTTSLPDRQALYLTAGKLADYTGSDAPPTDHGWQIIRRAHSSRVPVTIRLGQALGLAPAYRYPALYVTLYRRLD